MSGEIMAPRTTEQRSLACMQCFKSKCKCVSRVDGYGCERCHRLKKQCHPSDLLRRNANLQRRQNASARIVSLEEKVDNLTRLLSLVTQPPSSLASDAAIHGDGGMVFYRRLLSQINPDWSPTTIDPSTGDDSVAIHSSQTVSSPADIPSPCAGGNRVKASTRLVALDVACVEDAEACLATFRDKMLPSFPFVCISPETTVQQLQQDHPFLLRSIIAVASPLKKQKVLYGQDLKNILSQATIVQHQSSLDLLQGLLIFIAWSYDHIFYPSGALSRLTMLAISLACDLRLDKPLPAEEHMIRPMVVDSFEQECDDTKQSFVAEEQRAVLACYVLSTVISTYFAHIDPMKWKPRMEKFLCALEANKASSEDTTFALQVRLQLLAQRAVQIREQSEWEDAHTCRDAGASLSANHYIQLLQTQLHQLTEAFPQEVLQRGAIFMHIHYTRLSMNESARTSYLHESQRSQSRHGVSESGTTGLGSGCNPLEDSRLDLAWRSVGAIKACIDMFFSLSPGECAGLSFIQMAQLARCLVVLYRLSTLAQPEWDCALVRKTVDLLSVLECAVEHLEMASREAGEQSPEDVFMCLSKMMRKFHANAISQLNQQPIIVEDREDSNGRAENSLTTEATTAVQGQASFLSLDLQGDDILESVFGGFDGGWTV